MRLQKDLEGAVIIIFLTGGSNNSVLYIFSTQLLNVIFYILKIFF